MELKDYRKKLIAKIEAIDYSRWELVSGSFYETSPECGDLIGRTMTAPTEYNGIKTYLDPLMVELRQTEFGRRVLNFSSKEGYTKLNLGGVDIDSLYLKKTREFESYEKKLSKERKDCFESSNLSPDVLEKILDALK